MTKQSLKNKLKKAVVTRVISAIVASNSLKLNAAPNGNFIDQDLLKKPYLETSLVSDFVSPAGAIIEGQVRQDLINLTLNPYTSIFMWQNYSYKEDNFNERDFGVSQRIPIKKNLTASLGYQHWTYHSGTFGEYDNVINAGLHYNGFLDANLKYTHLFHKALDSGDRLVFKLSKNINLINSGIDMSLEPSVTAASLRSYYGTDALLSHITPGLSINFSKNNVLLNIFGNAQKSTDSDIKDKFWWGAKIRVNF